MNGVTPAVADGLLLTRLISAYHRQSFRHTSYLRHINGFHHRRHAYADAEFFAYAPPPC